MSLTRKAADRRTVSRLGLNLIAGFEGWVDHIYRDPVGIPTIGYGHVVQHGEHFPAKLTKTQGLELLRADAQTAVNGVRAALGKTPVTQREFDAMVSLAYNIGAGAFWRSSVARLLRAGDRRGAADAFLLWDKADGRVLEGLQRRRRIERNVFERVP